MITNMGFYRQKSFISVCRFFSSLGNSSAIRKPSRFYDAVIVQRFQQDDKNRAKFAIKLDERYLKSPVGRVLFLDSEELATLIAHEWDSQSKEIKRDSMHLTGLAFTALDNPQAHTKQTLVANMIDYTLGDTLLYFADPQTSLHDEQQKNWAPIIQWINSQYQLDLVPTESSIEQPRLTQQTKNKLERLLLANKFPTILALSYATEALKSVILTIAVHAHHLEVDKAVENARLEQLFQTRIWGSFEWAHDVEREELRHRLSAAILFAHFSSTFYKY